MGVSGTCAATVGLLYGGDPWLLTWEEFGPANVGTWRTTLAVEAGEPARALEHASAVDMAALPWRRSAWRAWAYVRRLKNSCSL